MPLIAGGVVLVAVLAGGGMYLSRGSAPAPAPAAASPAPAAPVAAAPAPAPEVAPAAPAGASAATIDNKWLNELMTLAANNDWAGVQAQVGQAQPLVLAAKDKAAARQSNAQAITALRSGDAKAALPLLTQALEQDPGDAEIQNNLGYAYLLTGQLDEARQHLLKTLQLAPMRAPAWVNTADLFAQRGNEQVAQAALKLAVFFATDRAKALASLSREDNLGHEKFKAVAKAVVSQADTIPSYKR